MLRIEAEKVLVVGDTHGDLESTLKGFQMAERYGSNILFLGDYVDRGPQQIENICEILERKLENPRRVHLLRGNHETVSMNEVYGFYDVVSRYYGGEVYRLFAGLFAELPYTAIIGGDVLCLHGGLPEGVTDVGQLSSLGKGALEPEDRVVVQLLWNDPDEDVEGFQPSPRGGMARLFGGGVLTRFMERNRLRLLIRAHQPVADGYAYLFGKRLLTVFSCRYYGLRPRAALISGKEISIEVLDYV